MDDEIMSLVLDSGTGVSKIGFSGEYAPRFTFPSVVGRLRNPNPFILNYKDTYVGNEAQNMRRMLWLKYPIERGIIMDWDDMEKIWHYAFHDKLNVNTNEYPIFITDSPWNPKANRQKMTEVIFEKFDVPAMYVGMQAVLSLFASGLTTGIVLESGDGISHTVPIDNGHAVTNAIVRSNLCGGYLTEQFMRQLNQRGYSFTTQTDRDIVREMKENLCYVAVDFQQEINASTISTSNEAQFKLPDGQVITVGNERFCCPEALFCPKLFGIEEESVTQIIQGSIMKCHIDIRKNLYNNIVLSGGNTKFPGFGIRIEKEVIASVPSVMDTKVILPSDREYCAWIGASILASRRSSRDMWISKEEYNEIGSLVVHRKCF